jgi:hypothetical protein
MREDLLKEQLMSYAQDGTEGAVQPSAAQIYRRARRHYQRLAALAVSGALAAAGVGAVLGLRGTTPTVNPPQPPATNPGPAVPSTTATTRPPAATTSGPPGTKAGAVAPTGKVPATFSAVIGGRVVVMSTTTGKLLRTLWSPHPLGRYAYAAGSSPDGTSVYFSTHATDVPEPCREPGIFRVPSGGGPATRVVPNENAASLITTSADGSRVAYLGSACSSTGRIDVVLRDAGGRLLHRWAGRTITEPGGRPEKVSLGPDGRRLAVAVFDNLLPVGVRLLDAATGTSIDDGRLITAPDPGCVLVNAAFQPGTGRLAAFERCPRPGLPSTAHRPGTVPRFQLLYLDPASGRLLARSLAFQDRTGGDLHLDTMDFDQSGRHLLYTVSSADPADWQKPPTGTWRHSGGRPVRIPDDRQLQRVGTSQFLPAGTPSW